MVRAEAGRRVQLIPRGPALVSRPFCLGHQISGEFHHSQSKPVSGQPLTPSCSVSKARNPPPLQQGWGMVGVFNYHITRAC